MKYNHFKSFFCIKIFLFSFSSHTYDWCYTEGQQTALLGCGGRRAWKPWKHSACVCNPLALPESRQIPAQAPCLFNTCIKERLPNLHDMKAHQDGAVVMDCSPALSLHHTPPSTRLVLVSIPCLSGSSLKGGQSLIVFLHSKEKETKLHCSIDFSHTYLHLYEERFRGFTFYCCSPIFDGSFVWLSILHKSLHTQ